MKSAEIRRVYLDFFKEKGHVVVPGIGLIPFDDPTILFTSAGMVQFKKLWATDASLSYLRAVTCQKCIRAGGKDSDIDKIGVTGRHHTFFEMLGNFSFGDYFKKEAIEWAYEFVIDRLKIPEDSLWVSYYFDDKETCHIWKKFLPEERIIPLGEKDNFWGPAGETGPCGPCTELYIDFGVAKGCGKDCLPGCECDRFLEFGNLVFPQYDKQKDGSLVNLKRRGVDTGMGLERVSRILQKTPSNYETDLFLPLIKEIENISGESYENQQKRPSFRITSDHIRAAVFLIDDNILPSNEGRGYVLRRILRRAGITGKNLRVKEYFLKDLAEVVINTMKDVYPSLEKNSELIKRVISEEEEKFHLLLDSAGKNFHDLIGKIQSGLIPGNIAFKLYDTYGIPKDLLEDLASKDNLQIDWIEFEKELEKQKRSSRISTLLGMQKEVVVESPSLTETIFTGYERIQAKGKISAVYLDAKKQLYLVLDSTPFYSEKGGQCGDRGIIEGKGFKFKVKDTQVDEKGIIYHIGKLEKGILSEIKENVEVTATVDKRFREQVSINHTATHLLHYALREILGRDIRQAGSYVSGERLRFDFVSFRQIEKEDIDRVEKLIQEKIMEKTPVEIYEMSVDEAIEKGAIALFMERYGEKVRVIRTGDYHTEVCGGTHISDTGDILLFRITGFSSIGQNLKRIEAVTHREAIDYLDAYKRTVEEIAERVDSESDKVLQKIDRLIAENIKQGRIIEKYEDTYASSLSEKIAEKRESYNIDGIGYYFVAEMIEIEDNGFLGKISDIIADKIEPGITFVGGIKDGKISIILKVSERLKEKFPAVRLIKEISEIIGGQGGGSPTFARGSGKEPNNFHKAVEKIRTLIEIGGK